jgi:hypothetical protein
VGYKKKTTFEVLIQMSEIKRLQAIGHSDAEIIKELRMRRQTYYHYLKNIFWQERRDLKQTSEDMVHEIMLLKERLTRTVRNCESIATDKKMNPYLRLEAERLKAETAVNILRLAVQCPYVIEGKDIGSEDKGIAEQKDKDNASHLSS